MKALLIRAAIVTAVMATIASVGLAQASSDEVTAETKRVFEAYSHEHDASLYAEDATFTDMTNPGQPFVGREAIGAMLAMFYGGAFEDGNYRDDTWIADGNMVFLEFTFYGTHTGDLGAIPTTGRSVELPMMSIYRIEDGQIQWARLYYDSLTLLRQLGLAE